MALSVFNQNYRISSFSLGLHYIMGVSGDTRSAGAVASKASVALHCCIVASKASAVIRYLMQCNVIFDTVQCYSMQCIVI